MGATYYFNRDHRILYSDGALQDYATELSVGVQGGVTLDQDLATPIDIMNSSGFVDVSVPIDTSGDQWVFSMGSSSVGNVRFEISLLPDGALTVYTQSTTAGNASAAYLAPKDGQQGVARRVRIFWNFETGTPRTVWNGWSDTAVVADGGTMTSVDQIGIGYLRAFGGIRPFGGEVHQICIWQTPLTDAALLGQVKFWKSGHPLHVIGDSFNNGGVFRSYIDKGVDGSGRHAFSSQDGVGGTDIVAHAVRYALTPEYYDATLVINDGGLQSYGTNVTAIADMVARMPHARWLYMEPNPVYLDGTTERDDWNAEVDAIRAYCGPEHFCDTLAGMQAAGDGLTNDNADVAGDIWPRSLLDVDLIHPIDAGQAVLGDIAYNKMFANGYI